MEKGIPQEVTYGDKTYTLDQFGFLDPSDQWDEAFAEGIARDLGISGGMTADHWSFIHYLRKKFLEEKTVPVLVVACGENKIRLDRLKHLFPTGYFRGACKVAGINHKFMWDTNHWLTYETTPVFKASYKMTGAGFLEDFSQWDERFAQLVLREWGFTEQLTDQHRQVISYLRQTFTDTGNIPTLYETLKVGDLSLDRFGEIFPGGYRRGACRMAGLPFFG